MKKKYITGKEFDEKFETGEDLSEYLDLDNARRPELDKKKININLPAWMINQVDEQAKKMGTSRQAILKVWIAEKLKDHG
jgi:hypothetical protein